MIKASSVLKRAVDILFPARCAACREPVDAHGALCGQCWQHMHFIADPVCCKCGLPFGYNIGALALCGRCMEHKPVYTQARAVLRYDEASKGQVLAFKYHDKTQLAPVFGAWLARIADDYAAKAHAVVPVPLHYARLIGRRYNQAALLAHALGRRINLPVLPDALRRTRQTPAQSGLNRRQRIENMRAAFRVPLPRRALLKGKSVILVDDVMTTGATLDACSRALHDSGVHDVYVLTVARTVIAD
jgi:ComF family protein